MIAKVNERVASVRKIDDKNSEIYILEGDIILKDDEKKYGEAASKYDMAIYFAPDFGLGYIKSAQIYENVNASLAIEKLKTIIERQPNYTIAYGYLGKIYTQNGFYQQAIDMYRTFFQSGIYSVDDIEMYVRVLYFTDDFENAKKYIKEGLQIDLKHFVLNRYLMYIYAKTKDIDNGLEVAGKFFSLRDTSGYIPQDYKMYALILKNAKRYEEAFTNFEKAINIDPNALDIYADAAATAREKRDYKLSAEYVKKQMIKKAELSKDSNSKDDIIDINTLGYDYYSAGVTIAKNPSIAEETMRDVDFINQLIIWNNELNADLLKKDIEYFSKNYSLYFLNKADSTFDILIENSPGSYSGYRFKALTKHAINPVAEEGVSVPYYEKVVEIIANKENISNSEKRVLLEAYNYIGYYYYLNKDKPNTILYWTKVLELDPENINAKLVLDEMNK